jgi:hypothetical protein
MGSMMNRLKKFLWLALAFTFLVWWILFVGRDLIIMGHTKVLLKHLVVIAPGCLIMILVLFDVHKKLAILFIRGKKRD